MDQESSESRVNGDGDKQILAPAEGPRENLISTAVKFLQNPKVMSSPLYQKRAFLEKKGLTQEEINIAVERSGVKEIVQADGAPSQPGPPVGYQPGMMAPGTQAVTQYYAPIPPQSRWARARDLTVTTVIVASVSYGVYHLFQKYLRPLVFGKTAQEQRLERLEGQIEEIQKSVTDSLSEMTRVLAGIQTTLSNQQSQALHGHGEMRGISDLKADIASLKGLLLNRSQFPPAPATSPILPSWQRAQSSAPPVQTSSSYADVLKNDPTTSHSGDPSTSQHLSSADSSTSDVNGLETSPGAVSTNGLQPLANGEDGNQDGRDLSYSEEADSDTLTENGSS